MKILDKLKTRSIAIILLIVGSFILAAIDPSCRPAFNDLVKIGVGGYLAQLIPGIINKS
ncbi:hypothetical protein [Tolypothrix sp. NIES-4075]|uniref:hypothetical protein n=1 Tax=Tolypothrix sp. NIES-4075 TaxID=2005459 RepID=UPI00135A196F|nr:hypothetical protein [Tolypothrix sp. NIES-4075]